MGTARILEVMDRDEQEEDDLQEFIARDVERDVVVESGAGEAVHTVSSREHIRRQMEMDIQAFLASGGTIRRIEPHVMADPPRRPVSAYGSRPI